MHLYAGDYRDLIPWANWEPGDYKNGAGWLYSLDPSADGPGRFKVQTGLYWKYLQNPRLYFCPSDKTNTSMFAQRSQQISSYIMNGAVIGYDRMEVPSQRVGNMAPEAFAFWEEDEKSNLSFNDGSSFPKGGVSARHNEGALNGTFEGSVEYIKVTTWIHESRETNRNRLWCYPDDPHGR